MEEKLRERIKELEDQNKAYLSFISSLVSSIRILVIGSERILANYKNLYNKHKSDYDTGVALHLETRPHEAELVKAKVQIDELLSKFRKK